MGDFQPPSGISLGKKLGRGSYATVYRGHDHVLRRDVAVKRVPKETDRGISCLPEILLLQSLQHRNIVRLYRVLERENCVYLVEELAREDMTEFSKGRSVSEEMCERVVRDTSMALMLLHDRDIVHGDIKSNNLLYFPGSRGKPGSVKVCDLGLATVRGCGPKITNAPSFRPPELWRNSTNIQPHSDIWSLGCTLYDIYYGRPLFYQKEASRATIKRRFLSSFRRWETVRKRMIEGESFRELCGEGLDVSKDFDPDSRVGSFILWLLNPRPSLRPSAMEILSHAFVYDSERLSSRAIVRTYVAKSNMMGEREAFRTLGAYTQNKSTIRLAWRIADALSEQREELERLSRDRCGLRPGWSSGPLAQRILLELAYMVAYKVCRNGSPSTGKFLTPVENLLALESCLLLGKVQLPLLSDSGHSLSDPESSARRPRRSHGRASSAE